jgi:hypothetical protein
LKRTRLAIVCFLLCGCAVSQNRPAPPAESPTPIIPKRGEIVIAAWTEPRYLPRGGGVLQVIVRVQRVGGEAYPGVQVQLQTNAGNLYSAGRPLVTDAQGMCRDRLTASQAAELVVRIGDTRYRFRVTPRPDAE